MEIKGYKAFNRDGTNMAGKVLKPGIYYCDGEIIFGPRGNGYHFALRLEDTIRYADCDDSLRNPIIAEVIGRGEIVESFDEYNGYYDLYVCSELEIVRYLTRQEIITLALALPPQRMKRFVSLFELFPEEILLFQNIDFDVDLALDYHQRRISETYDGENIKNKYLSKKIVI